METWLSLLFSLPFFLSFSVYFCPGAVSPLTPTSFAFNTREKFLPMIGKGKLSVDFCSNLIQRYNDTTHLQNLQSFAKNQGFVPLRDFAFAMVWNSFWCWVCILTLLYSSWECFGHLCMITKCHVYYWYIHRYVYFIHIYIIYKYISQISLGGCFLQLTFSILSCFLIVFFALAPWL